MRETLVPVARWGGWTLAVAVTTAISLTLTVALLSGPVGTPAEPGMSPVNALVVSRHDAEVLLRTLGIGVMATSMAFLLALPAIVVLSAARGRLARAALCTLMVWPMLAPPSLVGYAWILMATQDSAIGALLRGLGWNELSMRTVVAAWMQAAWLWPVPALALAAAFRGTGATVYRLALLDAAPALAFFRAALPAMRGGLLTGAGVTFVLSISDGSVPALAFAPVWSTEMTYEVTCAAQLLHPTAFLLWRSWPMLLVIAAATALVAWNLRRAWDAGPTDPGAELGRRGLAPLWLRGVCLCVSGLVSLMPMAVFVAEFRGSGRLLETLSSSLRLYADSWRASLLTVFIVFVLAVLMGVAAMDAARRDRQHAVLVRAVGAVLLALAVLPPAIVARAIITLLDTGPTATLYDATPAAWVAGLLARYGFIAWLIVAVAARRAGLDIGEQAMTDGALPRQVAAHVRWPALARPILGCALLTAGLSMCELPVSTMLVPVRFGGSLAVAIDQQIHFGRQAAVVAMCLVLVAPAMVCAFFTAWLLQRRER